MISRSPPDLIRSFTAFGHSISSSTPSVLQASSRFLACGINSASATHRSTVLSETPTRTANCLGDRLADRIADLSALFNTSPEDFWAFFHATAETSQASSELHRKLLEGA